MESAPLSNTSINKECKFNESRPKSRNLDQRPNIVVIDEDGETTDFLAGSSCY